MKPSLLAILVLLAGASCGASAQGVPVPPNTAQCLNADEEELLRLANQYRQQNGLPAIAVSYWLSSVGQWHVWDLVANNPVVGNCNLHSWSGARPALWQAVCYTPDHAQAQQMWQKPTQLSAGTYTGTGYEIAAGSTGSLSPAAALALWQNSPGHNQVILNQGPWANLTWRAIGAGLSNGRAVIWFSDRADPSSMAPCPTNGVLFANGFEP